MAHGAVNTVFQDCAHICVKRPMILVSELLTDMPYITSEVDHGVVDFRSSVRLACDVKSSLIYYTLDGSYPELRNKNIKVNFRIELFIQSV